jgi:Ca2+-binding EF-hand superfamily protein
MATNNSNSTVSSGPDNASLKKEFDFIDADKSGFVDPSDISKLLGGYVPMKYINQAIAAVDTNKDGKLSFEEYKKIRSQLPAFNIPSGK